MNTPIVDFIDSYTRCEALRLHMPGHKGQADPADITEINGADSLYEAAGIIRESEQNASALFGADTFYSTEGSSHTIRAMLYLAVLYAKQQGRAPRVLAGRNAHKTFVNAAALLDVEVEWLCPSGDTYLSCAVDAAVLEEAIDRASPAAVYLTSPDYLGATVDLPALAQVCRRRKVLLLVDNAHGAYLKFLSPSHHPMDCGAHMCCDSAHKTLPVLTGGAYLHISKDAPALFAQRAKEALSLFGSTSPSYLILRSLDLVNCYLADGYSQKLSVFAQKIAILKENLTKNGYALYGDEPLKLTVCPKACGYTGYDLAGYLQENGIVCEFADPDFTVMMLTPALGEESLRCLQQVLLTLPKRPALEAMPPLFHLPRRVLSARQAVFSESETVSVCQSTGRVLASTTVGCPPAVPLVVCGECIDESVVRALQYYGIDRVSVVKY